jgi:hypothetical protein
MSNPVENVKCSQAAFDEAILTAMAAHLLYLERELGKKPEFLVSMNDLLAFRNSGRKLRLTVEQNRNGRFLVLRLLSKEESHGN